jgi:hypothetical protein
MNLVALSSLFLIAWGCTVPVFAQAIQVAEIGQPAKLVPGSRKIDRLLMPRITLRIYDFDHVEPAAIASAKEVASEIFLQAGDETLRVDCPWMGHLCPAEHLWLERAKIEEPANGRRSRVEHQEFLGARP